jgi:hypothetical protein
MNVFFHTVFTELIFASVFLIVIIFNEPINNYPVFFLKPAKLDYRMRMLLLGRWAGQINQNRPLYYYFLLKTCFTDRPPGIISEF